MQTDLEEYYIKIELGELYLFDVTPETRSGLQIAKPIYKAV